METEIYISEKALLGLLLMAYSLGVVDENKTITELEKIFLSIIKKAVSEK